MGLNDLSHEPRQDTNAFVDVIIDTMTNDGFEDRILDTENYRKASVRGVLFDQEKKVAVIYSPVEEYYKLPGGGIEGIEGIESNEIALGRESQEEAGVNVYIVKYIGTIVEQNKAGQVIQHNRGFIAEVMGEKGESALTHEEAKRKFTLLRMGIDEAIELFKKNSPKTYRGKFMQTRDLKFLEEAKKLLSLGQ